jgi:hypothetical protein
MARQAVGFRILLLVAVAILALGQVPAKGQNNNNTNNNLAQNGVAGVEVNAQGVLERKTFFDPGGAIWRERLAAARASLNRNVMPLSQSRKVSLTRLEQAIVAHNGAISDEMRYLAGLLRVRYVFYLEDTKDIVVAGPAEGWVADASNHVVGITTNRPVLQLQDLAVALRAFAPGKSATDSIGCSIDPTPEGLSAMQAFLRRVGTTMQPGQQEVFAMNVMQGLRESLGMHTVSVHGVSPNTHFAQVLVEADYRMKLIGLRLENPPVRMVAYVDRLQGSHAPRNALIRWYFVPEYQCVRVCDDGLGMELVGDGVKLVGEEEMVTAGGERRQAAGRGNPASQAFVTSFTKNYSTLAERSPVYAELRNLVDLSVAAAFIQKQDYYKKAGWKMEFLGNERSFPVETASAPKQVESTVTSVFRGGRLTTPIAGGVKIEPLMAVKPDNMLPDSKGKVAEVREEVKSAPAPGQWWWD